MEDECPLRVTSCGFETYSLLDVLLRVFGCNVFRFPARLDRQLSAEWIAIEKS